MTNDELMAKGDIMLRYTIDLGPEPISIAILALPLELDTEEEIRQVIDNIHKVCPHMLVEYAGITSVDFKVGFNYGKLELAQQVLGYGGLQSYYHEQQQIDIDSRAEKELTRRGIEKGIEHGERALAISSRANIISIISIGLAILAIIISIIRK